MDRIRQERIIENTPESITIIGAGGIGCWVAYFAARAGVKHITVYDSDVVKQHNLNRTLYTSRDIGAYKVDVLKRIIEKDIHGITVLAIPCNCDTNDITSAKIVVDCTDSYNSQLELYRYCKNNGIKYIRAGAKEHRCTVTTDVPANDWNEKNTGEENENTCGVTIQQWIAPQVIAAALAVARVLDINIEINNF